MSRRSQPARAAKRARSPLADLSVNTIAPPIGIEHKYDEPDLNLLSLASEHVAAADNAAADSTDENQPPPPKQRKKRGKYHPRLTTEQRKDILTMWISEGMDAPHIIAHFQRKGIPIARSTIDNILRRQRNEGRVALKATQVRTPKYTDEDRVAMAKFQDENHEWGYDRVRAEWKQWWSRRHDGAEAPTPSNYTLHHAFDKYAVSTKNLNWIPVVRNTPRLIEWRKKYCTEAMRWDRENLVFVDETGFNMHVHKRRGRSARGTPAYAKEKNSAGYRINVCAAVSPVQGLVKYKCIVTSYNTEEFATFMQELLETPLLQGRSCIICMDNVSWHHRDEIHDVLAAGRVEHHIKRIPAYSPQLNPIEYAFSVWKAAIKRVDQLTTSITLQQQIDNAAALITDRLITRCLDHVYKYYLHCIQGLPLEKFDARLARDGGVGAAGEESEKEMEVEEEEKKVE